MHLSDELLTAYRDAELPQSVRKNVREHLDSCSACINRLEALQRTSARFELLIPPAAYHVSPHAALQHFTARQKENPMKTLFRRPALIAAGLVVILAAALAFPPVQAIANSFLGLFRVQQVRVVSFDPSAAENYSSALENNSERLQAFFNQNLTISHTGSYQEGVSREVAAAAAGFTPRLPKDLQVTSLDVNPAQTADLTIDSALMNSILDALGRKDVSIPSKLDGQKIHADIPSIIIATLDDCLKNAPSEDSGSAPSQDLASCTQLIQFSSPTVQAPESFPIVQLAETMLQMLGMDSEQVSQFSQSIDWASTLVIPVPTTPDTKISEVTVDGVSGTLVSAAANSEYTLIWVKNGYVYALHGYGDPNKGLDLANSLR